MGKNILRRLSEFALLIGVELLIYEFKPDVEIYDRITIGFVLTGLFLIFEISLHFASIVKSELVSIRREQEKFVTLDGVTRLEQKVDSIEGRGQLEICCFHMNFVIIMHMQRSFNR
jgi:hypothetical protein